MENCIELFCAFDYNQERAQLHSEIELVAAAGK
jgi:hypothetical protein